MGLFDDIKTGSPATPRDQRLEKLAKGSTNVSSAGIGSGSNNNKDNDGSDKGGCDILILTFIAGVGMASFFVIEVVKHLSDMI